MQSAFVVQRALYEVRERPSRVYPWKVFIFSQMLVEVPWQVGLGVCSWASFYFSVIGPDQRSERKALVMLFIVQFYVYAATTLMFGLSFIFNGVMQPPSKLPRFWIFMYRVSPFTYYVGGISGTALHGRPVQCNEREMSVFDPPLGQSCQEYLALYLSKAGGQLYNPSATAGCEYCSMTSANVYLSLREIYWGDRWRDYGIFWCYFMFNIFCAIALYYVFRVRKWNAQKGRK